MPAGVWAATFPTYLSQFSDFCRLLACGRHFRAPESGRQPACDRIGTSSAEPVNALPDITRLSPGGNRIAAAAAHSGARTEMGGFIQCHRQ
jgi:hypothetical protein